MKRGGAPPRTRRTPPENDNQICENDETMATKSKPATGIGVQFARFSAAEQITVNAIVDRAVLLWRAKGAGRIVRKDLEMDLSATHATCPLNFAKLLGADDFNFAHDIGGIIRHLNRETGELGDFFHPRRAKPRPRLTCESCGERIYRTSGGLSRSAHACSASKAEGRSA